MSIKCTAVQCVHNTISQIESLVCKCMFKSSAHRREIVGKDMTDYNIVLSQIGAIAHHRTYRIFISIMSHDAIQCENRKCYISNFDYIHFECACNTMTMMEVVT